MLPFAKGKTPPRNLLVLVMHPARQSEEDMAAIAREVVKSAPDITVHIVRPGGTAGDLPAWKWELPALTVALGRSSGFVPRRGPMLHNRPVKKLDQYCRFAACGIPSPHTERFGFGQRYCEQHFGSHVVLKPLPLDLTSSMGNMMLCETRRLQLLRPDSFAPDHFLRRAPALVQRFIDTGPRPEYFRVLTLLGEPILWMRVKSAAEQADFSSAGADLAEQAIIDPRSTYAAAKEGFSELIEFVVPEDVSSFAREVYSAFPDIPLQACDIVREEAAGTLHILEINAGGNTWDFSSKRVEAARERIGGRDRLVSLFDPWPRAARALIAKTRQLAR